MNAKLALTSILIIPIYCLIFKYFRNIIISQSEDFYTNSAKINSQLLDTLQSMELFRIYDCIKENVLKYLLKYKEYYKSNIKLEKTMLKNNFVLSFIMSLYPMLIVCIGGYFVMKSQFSIGSLIAFLTYISYIFNPITSIFSSLSSIQKSYVALKRINQIINYPDKKFSKLDNFEKVELTGVDFWGPSIKVCLQKKSLTKNGPPIKVI